MSGVAEQGVQDVEQTFEQQLLHDQWSVNTTVLSPQEVRVLRMKSVGALDKHIATELQIADETVKSYVKRLRAKLRAAGYANVGTALGLRTAARAAGYIDDLPLI